MKSNFFYIVLGFFICLSLVLFISAKKRERVNYIFSQGHNYRETIKLNQATGEGWILIWGDKAGTFYWNKISD